MKNKNSVKLICALLSTSFLFFGNVPSYAIPENKSDSSDLTVSQSDTTDTPVSDNVSPASETDVEQESQDEENSIRLTGLPACSPTSSTYLYQSPDSMIPENIITDPKDIIVDRISKKDLELSVSAPSIVETTPGQFCIDVNLKNNRDEALTGINVNIAFHNDDEISLIPPVPNIQNVTIIHNKRFSFNVNVDHIYGGNKRFAFCVYVYKEGALIDESAYKPSDFPSAVISFDDEDMTITTSDDESVQEKKKNYIPALYLISSYVQQVHLNESKSKKAIIVIPGICGSELFSETAQVIDGNQYSAGYRIWPPEGAMDIVDGGCMCGLCNTLNTDSSRLISDVSLISCDDQGNSKAQVMLSNPIIDCRENPDERNFGSVNCYGDLIHSLTHCSFLSEYQIVFFSYDWRISNDMTSQALKDFIDEQKFSNVVLIGHSMGGLICASYASDAGNRAKIEKVILLGPPLLGAAKALSAMEKGTFFDGFVGLATAPVAHPFIRSLAQTCPSVYQLLPPKQAFTNINDGYIYESNGACGFCSADRYDPDDYDASVRFINARQWTNSSNDLLEKAQEFHDSLYDESGKLIIANPELIDTYNIVGFNSGTSKAFYVKFKNRGKTLKFDTVECNGDGTVALDSSTAKDGFAVGKVYYAKNISHMGLMQDKNCLELINNIINKRSDNFNPNVIQKYFPGRQISTAGCLPPILSCLECN